jgi:hypothetical protein
MVLGMECISSQHQPHLDQWLRGQTSEDQFLRAVQYDEAWGFPWENYRGLFHFARDHGMEIVALNRPRELLPPHAAMPVAKRAGDLGARDEWAAGLIVDELLRPRARKVIAVYGEYHLSPSHLPTSIREVARRNGLTAPEYLVLHQNRDELFWKLAAKGLEQHASLIALEGNHLCVFSGTPWTKLQSLVNWIRGDRARFVDEDEGDAEEEFLQWMRIYGNGVSKFFQIPDAGYGTLHLAKWEDLEGGPRWWRKLLQAQERDLEKFRDSVSVNPHPLEEFFFGVALVLIDETRAVPANPVHEGLEFRPGSSRKYAEVISFERDQTRVLLEPFRGEFPEKFVAILVEDEVFRRGQSVSSGDFPNRGR